MKTLFTHNPSADRVCKKSKLGSVLFVILSILLLCLSLTACGGIAGKTDLAPYLSVRYSGYNGNGTAHVDFDFADFEYSIMSGWKGGNNLEKLAELTAVEMTITYKADVSEGLRNGDKITVKIDLDKELARKYGYSFTGLEKKFTVEGLDEAVMIDPFDAEHLSVSVQGVSPFAYMEILYIGSRTEPQAHITYKADKQYNLKNGDTVTITATMNEKYTKKGYMLTRSEMVVKVEGLQSYITDVAALSRQDVAGLRDKMDTYFSKTIAEDYVNLAVGGGEYYISGQDIADIGTLTFMDTGYAVVQDGWGVTAVVIIPFQVDVNGVRFAWWNGDYYSEPLMKNFEKMSGYFIISQLMLDENGQLIKEDGFRWEMSSLYENEQQMVQSITDRFGEEGVYLGKFAQ